MLLTLRMKHSAAHQKTLLFHISRIYSCVFTALYVCVYHVFSICRISQLLLTVNIQFVS